MAKRPWGPSPELREAMNAGNGPRSWDRADGLLRSYAETGDLKSRNDAVECCLSVAWLMAAKFWHGRGRVRLSEDDLVGYATEGLMSAAERYASVGDWSRPFRRLAQTSAWNAMSRANYLNGGVVKIGSTLAYRKDPRAVAAMNGSALTLDDGGGDANGRRELAAGSRFAYTMDDGGATARESVARIDAKDESDWLFSSTPMAPELREAVAVNFGLGVPQETMAALARRRGVSRTWLGKLKDRGIEEIRAFAASAA